MKTKQALVLLPVVEHFYNPKSLLAKMSSYCKTTTNLTILKVLYALLV